MAKHPFILSATVDFPDDVIPGPYDGRLLDDLMGTLKSMGVRRVYWLYYGDVEPESFWAGSLYENPQIPYGTQTLEAIGEPLKARCRSRTGMGWRSTGCSSRTTRACPARTGHAAEEG